MVKKMVITAAFAVGLMGIAPHAMAIGDHVQNEPCPGVPVKVNMASIVGLVPVSVLQDVPIVSAPQNQQCPENSTPTKGDAPLSHILDQIPVLPGNGAGRH